MGSKAFSDKPKFEQKLTKFNEKNLKQFKLKRRKNDVAWVEWKSFLGSWSVMNSAALLHYKELWIYDGKRVKPKGHMRGKKSRKFICLGIFICLLKSFFWCFYLLESKNCPLLPFHAVFIFILIIYEPSATWGLSWKKLLNEAFGCLAT